jgi:hypothetical protein
MAFECTLMEDPVVASDGHTYDRKDIQNWFNTHDISPHTNEPFEHKMLIPNIAIRKQVIAWREKHGLPVPSFGAPARAQAAGGGGSTAAPQILKPASLCGFSKQPLMVFCVTCDKAICVSCASTLPVVSHTTRGSLLPLYRVCVMCTPLGCSCATSARSSCRRRSSESTPPRKPPFSVLRVKSVKNKRS